MNETERIAYWKRVERETGKDMFWGKEGEWFVVRARNLRFPELIERSAPIPFGAALEIQTDWNTRMPEWFHIIEEYVEPLPVRILKWWQAAFARLGWRTA